MRTTKQLQLWSAVLVCAGILGAAVAAMAGPGAIFRRTHS